MLRKASIVFARYTDESRLVLQSGSLRAVPFKRIRRAIRCPKLQNNQFVEPRSGPCQQPLLGLLGFLEGMRLSFSVRSPDTTPLVRGILFSPINPDGGNSDRTLFGFSKLVGLM